MTILTNLGIDKKEQSDLDPPVVYTDDEPDLDFKKKTFDDEDRVFLPPQPAAVLIATRKRNRKIAQCCLLLTAVFVVCLGVMSGIYMYRHFARRAYVGTCGVRGGGYEMIEDIETDQQTYERIGVPGVSDFRQSTILHDFEKNYTAIVDKDSWECFVMPLNHTTVKPPKDFWDLVSKLQSGYYMPDEEMVRENYHILEPPLSDLSPYGYYIWRECRQFVTYRLQRLHHTPMALVKREACMEKNYLYSAGVNMMNIHTTTC